MPCKNIINYKLDMREKKELTWSLISEFGSIKDLYENIFLDPEVFTAVRNFFFCISEAKSKIVSPSLDTVKRNLFWWYISWMIKD